MLADLTGVLADDDEEIISPTVAPEETIQIQGCDREYPAVVIRRSTSVDKRRRTIKTISRKGKFANVYEAYKEEIEAYKTRRANRCQQSTRPDNAGGYSAIRSVGPVLAREIGENQHGENRV